MCRNFTVVAAVSLLLSSTCVSAAPGYRVYVSNEKSGDVSVIDGRDFSVVDTVAVGKRPRGLHVSPDGKTLYVAVSGTPAEGPPQIDAKGNPVFADKSADDDAAADKSADGIAIVDTGSNKLLGKLRAGSDPEEFALSKDGKHIYISNEDVKTASVISIASATVEQIIPVGQEPEGVTTTPDGRQFYITCEAGGDIYVVDAVRYVIVGHFKVNGRPRSVAFMSKGGVGFIPSESAGELNVIDTVNAKVVQTIVLPKGSRPMRARLAPDEKKLYVSNGRAGTVAVYDAQSYALLDTIQVGARPWGIAISPDGRFLFSANGPSNDVSVVDLASVKEVARVKVGTGPWGIAIGGAAQE